MAFNQEAKDYINTLKWDTTADQQKSAIELRSKMAEKGWSADVISESSGLPIGSINNLLGIQVNPTIADHSQAVLDAFAVGNNTPIYQQQAAYVSTPYGGYQGASNTSTQGNTTTPPAASPIFQLVNNQAEGRNIPDIKAFVDSLDWSAEGTAASAQKLAAAMLQQGATAADIAASTGQSLAGVQSLLNTNVVARDPGTSGSAVSYVPTGSSLAGFSGSPTAGSSISGVSSVGGLYPAGSYMSAEDVSNKTWSDWMTKEKPALEAQAALADKRGNEGYDFLNKMARTENTDLTRMREDNERYGSQAYQDQNAGRYMADVQRQSDDQYAQLQRQAYASGIDPTKLLAQTANQRAYGNALGKVQAGMASRNQDAAHYSAGLGAVTTASAADKNSRAQMMTEANKLGTQGLTAGMELSKLSGAMGTGANNAYTGTMNAESGRISANASATSAAASMMNATTNRDHLDRSDSLAAWRSQEDVNQNAYELNRNTLKDNNTLLQNNYDDQYTAYKDRSTGLGSSVSYGIQQQQANNTRDATLANIASADDRSQDAFWSGLLNTALRQNPDGSSLAGTAYNWLAPMVGGIYNIVTGGSNDRTSADEIYDTSNTFKP